MTPTVSRPSLIAGAVDGLHAPSKAYGWVLDQGDHGWGNGQDIEIRASVDGHSVEVTCTRHQRGDLTGLSPDNRAGFTITLGVQVEAIDWLLGRIVIEGRLRNGSSYVVKFSKRFRSTVLKEMISEFLISSTPRETKDFFLSLSNKDSIPGDVLGAFRNLARPANKTLSLAKNVIGTTVILPAGTTALDGFAVLGNSGHIFLTGGSNGVKTLYEIDDADPTMRAEVDAWLHLFRDRNVRIKGMTAKYVQLIVPEKISVLPHLFSEEVAVPTPRLRLIEHTISQDNLLSENYIPCISVFKGSSSLDDVFYRADTHLSELGCYILFREIVKFLNLGEFEQPDFQITNGVWSGDLSNRFFGVPLLNKRATVSSIEIERLSKEKILVRTLDPLSGHIGKIRVWVNPLAPYQLKLVAFANSFFEDGSQPRNLSWWFSRYFKEFHFIWSPEIDDQYIAEVRPDIVIGQTIERFLTRVPKL